MHARTHAPPTLAAVVAVQASAQQGVLIVFIALDNPSASLLDMKSVDFGSGRPVFRQYLDTFPFPFYLVLRDIAALPATLADLLRQFFQLDAQRSA